MVLTADAIESMSVEELEALLKARKEAEKDTARINALRDAGAVVEAMMGVLELVKLSCADVDSDSTAKLMVAFYTHLSDLQSLSSKGKFTMSRGRDLLGIPQPEKKIRTR